VSSEINSIIKEAFEEARAFPFLVDRGLVAELKAGEDPGRLVPRFTDLVRGIFDEIARGDQSVRGRLGHDARLGERLATAVAMVHRVLASRDYSTLPGRRFVIVKERPGSLCLHREGSRPGISHVGDGPTWMEVPTVYLGLGTFDPVVAEQAMGGRELFDALGHLLAVEERAIETGYTRIEPFPAEVTAAIERLEVEVIRAAAPIEIEPIEVEERAVPAFTRRKRQDLLRMLDARLPGDGLAFDVEKNLRGLQSLERRARLYKRIGYRDSLREVLRLLVAASGHDVHEVRNQACYLLERVLAPKEFDAPLATAFATVRDGAVHEFEFDLPGRGRGYFVRIYRTPPGGDLVLEKDLVTEDLDLERDEATGTYRARREFHGVGQVDFVVMRRKRKLSEWLGEPGTSGRINVVPDVRGELILEVFTDIHGHTRLYWNDGSGHPGLVYNENGEVIRTGRLSDVTAHLEDLRDRYGVTALYLLGVQARGTNRQDWAPEATNASPFSPMSLTGIEESIGGEAELRGLVVRAHELGLKVIVDVVPHLNRESRELPPGLSVLCDDGSGGLTERASTDGRYGSWNDGRLLNWRKLEVWEWLRDSVLELIDAYDIDGIRFDSAHAVPIMMKRDNSPEPGGHRRTHEEMLEGTVILNVREGGRFLTTGYYDSACRDAIAVPLHYFLMQAVERKLASLGKRFFVNIVECFWGHERFLTRTGVVAYNSALFKICESVIHGRSDVREIYNLYEGYYARSLPPGTELLGILGNHDERRALNTFGPRGLRPAVALTVFMSNVIMDYEGSAEGESWKVFLDNIHVNWNQFEDAANRSIGGFYREWYSFHRRNRGSGHLVRTDNPLVAAALRFADDGAWLGVFNFSDANQAVSIEFHSPELPFDDDAWYRIVDPVYSPVTKQFGYFTGRELRVSRLHTTVSFTDRVKLLRLERMEESAEHYHDMLRDSFYRLCELGDDAGFHASYAYAEIVSHADAYERLAGFVRDHLLPAVGQGDGSLVALGLKRALFTMSRKRRSAVEGILDSMERLAREQDAGLARVGAELLWHNARGSVVFLSAEAEPFSKSGGLANVVYELPRELVRMGEQVCLVTPLYRHGDPKSMEKMRKAVERYGVRYSGRNVRFKIHDLEYEVGVHEGVVEGVRCFLLDHHEFFDGLYWGYTAEEKLRRRVAFSRACAEVIVQFGLEPHFTFTNDAFAGIFNGIVRGDPVYGRHRAFQRTTFVHIIHNGGWQYFDSYYRWEGGSDLFSIFNMPSWKATDFVDPVRPESLNCMAASIRMADRVVTVSPSYARQIEVASDGLEHVLHDVTGVSNALGEGFTERVTSAFDASGLVEDLYPRLIERIRTDALLGQKVRSRYPELLDGERACEEIEDPSRSRLVTRMRNKLLVQLQRGLAVDPDAILFAMIHRVTEQKGFGLLLEASEGIFKSLGFQGIIGGAVSLGDSEGERLARGLEALRGFYPDRVSVDLGFQDVSVPLMASDVFLMPSLNEPGGISQLEAFSCGCLVVARATGGLRDTVHPIRVVGDVVEGNGFLFTDATPWSFYDAMYRCSGFMRGSSDRTILAARRNAENSVYTWETPARAYLDFMYGIKEVVRPIAGTSPRPSRPPSAGSGGGTSSRRSASKAGRPANGPG
jgi:starch synthase